MSFEKSSRRFLKSVCGTRMLLFMAALAGIIFLSASGISNAQSPSKARQLTSKAGPAYIKVTSPGRNEVWEKGKTYTILWESKGIQGNVKIMLLAGGPRPALKVSEAKAFEITRNINNSGSYSYLVPDNLPDGIYKVQIMTIDESIKGAGEGTITIRGQKSAVAKVASQQEQAKVAAAGKRGAQTDVAPSGKTAAAKTPEGAAASSAGATAATGKTASTAVTPAKGATATAAIAGKSQATAAKIVRQDITSVKVSQAEINNFKIQKSTVNAPNYKIGGYSTTGETIEVISPKDGDTWEGGKEYGISWKRAGITGEVKIVLEKITIYPGGKPDSIEEYPIIESTANTGSYRFRVPVYWVPNPYGYHVRVSSLDGKAHGKSRGAIILPDLPPLVDLECVIVDAKIGEQKTVYYYKATEEEKFFEFNVLLRNKGSRSPIMINTILTRIIKEPEEVVCYQIEWGTGWMYHNEWYKTAVPIRFTIETWKHYFKDFGRDVDLKKGAYRVEVELDPQNQLNENEELRNDNKIVKKWIIR